ncbi:MAG: outer membrane protein assembly factor BamB family protein, partial [Planctomycetota bacterium]
RKPLAPVEWKICDSLKWRGGTRAQHCSGFAEFVVKDGTISYLERMEVPGDIKTTRAQRFVRDAYNGRVLSAGEVTETQPKWSPTALAKSIAGRKVFPDPAKKSHWAGGCYKATRLGKYILSHHNIWDDTETKERTFPYLVHPACSVGPIPSSASGLIYNLPSRKSGVVSGITATCPTDVKLDNEPGENVSQKFAAAPTGMAISASDWPTFRANAARGNAVNADVGSKPVKAWETSIGRGGRHYGIMSGERTGLTQPVSAWGLVIVADIDAQRVVALDVSDGKEKWVYHVGSRVDMSPTLYKGLCIFAAKDGWIYALDARSGKLCYRVLVAPRERYIGGQEKLENLWPTKSDVLIHNGVGYASAGHGFAVLGGVRAVAFRPETGEIIWKQCYHDKLTRSDRQLAADLFTYGAGRKRLSMGSLIIDPATGKRGRTIQRSGEVLGTRKYSIETMLAFGNSLTRNAEDRSHTLVTDGRVKGRVIAFSKDLSVAFTIGKDRARVGRREYGGEINLAAAREAGKELWRSPPLEFVVDDIVLTPKQVYCVGHYERVKKAPELWVLSREDGKVLSRTGVDGFPAFMGTSAAGKRLFIATRDGKLICFEGK